MKCPTCGQKIFSTSLARLEKEPKIEQLREWIIVQMKELCEKHREEIVNTSEHFHGQTSISFAKFHQLQDILIEIANLE